MSSNNGSTTTTNNNNNNEDDAVITSSSISVLSSSFGRSLPKKAVDVVSLLNLIPHPEGGFFLETYRTGSIPMSSQGQTDFVVTTITDPTNNEEQQEEEEEENEADGSAMNNNHPALPTILIDDTLVTTNGRNNRRPDNDVRRNSITSIYWMATTQVSSSKMYLTINLSDDIHFYQGGLSFEYISYNPKSHTLQKQILGPDITRGQQLHVIVPGGYWKCGRIITPTTDSNNSNSTSIIENKKVEDEEYDYSLTAEAMGPGFDFYDVTFITQQDILNEAKRCDELFKDSSSSLVANLSSKFRTEYMDLLLSFVRPNHNETYTEFYDDDEQKVERIQDRLAK